MCMIHNVFRDFFFSPPPSPFSSPSVLFRFLGLSTDTRKLPKTPEEVVLFVRGARIRPTLMLPCDVCLPSNSGLLQGVGVLCVRTLVADLFAVSVRDLISAIMLSLNISEMPIWRHVSKAASSLDLAARASVSN
jgi:hypothetical protein